MIFTVEHRICVRLWTHWRNRKLHALEEGPPKARGACPVRRDLCDRMPILGNLRRAGALSGIPLIKGRCRHRSGVKIALNIRHVVCLQQFCLMGGTDPFRNGVQAEPLAERDDRVQITWVGSKSVHERVDNVRYNLRSKYYVKPAADHPWMTRRTQSKDDVKPPTLPRKKVGPDTTPK